VGVALPSWTFHRAADLLDNAEAAPGGQNPLGERASGEAAEGIRTLDLLHGKQTL
jgi:hypothetical protein